MNDGEPHINPPRGTEGRRAIRSQRVCNIIPEQFALRRHRTFCRRTVWNAYLDGAERLTAAKGLLLLARSWETKGQVWDHYGIEPCRTLTPRISHKLKTT